MKIKVVGKAHWEGKNKRTGNSYNFNAVHYNGPDRGVEGLAALVMNLDPGIIAYDAIRVGGEYDVTFGPKGYVVAFEPLTR